MARRRRDAEDNDNGRDDNPSRSSDRTDRQDDKRDRQVDKKDAKANLILAKAQKALAAAQKRKWLVILIVVLLGAYFALKSGGINFGSIGDKIKEFIP